MSERKSASESWARSYGGVRQDTRVAHDLAAATAGEERKHFRKEEQQEG